MCGSFVIIYVYLSDTPSVKQDHKSFYNKLPGEKKKKHTSKYHACICNLLLLGGKHAYKLKICFNTCYSKI